MRGVLSKFGGQTPHETVTMLLNSEYHLPGESIEIRALYAVVQRCLAKDPRDRDGSASEVAKELIPTLARCTALRSKSRRDDPRHSGTWIIHGPRQVR